MKTTSFNAENMQGATGIEAFVTPPPTASTSFSSQVALAPIESSISGNKAGDKVPASLWIQRLKPRDERETLTRETFASGTDTCHGFRIKKSDLGSSAHPFGGQATSSTKAWVNKALSKDKMLVDEGKTVLKLKWDSLNEIRRQQTSSIEQQDYGGERQQNMGEQGRGVTPSPIPSNSGFCQQISQIAGARLERKPITKSMTVDMNVNSRYTSEPAMILQTCSQAMESKSQVSHAVKVQAEGSILASSLGKPPLPPVHSKFGCPPKPTGHKSLGFSARSTGWITSSPTSSKVVAMPSHDIIRYPSHSAVKKETLLASDTSAGPLLIEGCQVKEDGLDCQNSVSKEDKIYTDDRWTCPSTQVVKSISGLQTTVPTIEPVMRQLPVSYNEGVPSSLMCKPPTKIARQDLEAMDVVTLGTGSSKNLKTIKVSHETGNVRGPSVQPSGESSTAVEQPSSSLLKDNSMQKPPSECSAGPGKAEESMEATSSTSTTANFPWEMFVEAAGPSKSAREEFVEVYNRARDELKNQKASSSVTKVSDKEMENHPQFASRHAACVQNTSIVMHGGQTSDRQLQPKILDKLKKVNGSVSQPEGAKVVHVPQDEKLSKRHHCASLLEGEVDIKSKQEVDIKSKQDSQAFQSIHATSGKDSTAFVWGQHGGPLHGYVEPPAVAPKDCSLTLGKSSEWKQGFASSAAPEQCYQAAATDREIFQTKFLDKAGRDIKDIQSKAPMLLSKRQRGIFESSPLAIVTGKESVHRERLPNRSDFWLQRWYPPHSSIKGVHEHKLLEADRTRQDLAGCSTGNVLEVKTRDEHGACEKATDLKQRLTDKRIVFQRIVEEAEPKRFSKKVLPSAAAMAIVGTAARQFCTVQPQCKGSFAFWSGFGRPAPQTPVIEKGKRKLPFEADPLAQP